MSTRKGVIAAFVDQSLLGGLALVVGLAFIHTGQPSEYGFYVLVMSGYYFASSIMNAVIVVPLTALTPRWTDAELGRFDQVMITSAVAAVVSIGAVAELCVRFVVRHPPLGSSPLVIAIAVLPQLLREYTRARQYGQMHLKAALLQDGIFVALGTVGIALLTISHSMKAQHVILILGGSSFVAVAVSLARMKWRWPSREDYSKVFGSIKPWTTWTLCGSLASWLQSVLYAYIPAVLFGIREVGVIAAARVVLTPATLLIQGSGYYFRAAGARVWHQDGADAARRLLRRGAIVLSAVIAVYAVLAIMVGSMAAGVLRPKGYHNLGPYLLMWAIIAVVQAIRGNASVLLQSALAFKRLGIFSIVGMIATLGATVPLTLAFGPLGGPAGLLAGECVLVLLMLTRVARTDDPWQAQEAVRLDLSTSRTAGGE